MSFFTKLTKNQCKVLAVIAIISVVALGTGLGAYFASPAAIIVYVLGLALAIASTSTASGAFAAAAAAAFAVVVVIILTLACIYSSLAFLFDFIDKKYTKKTTKVA